LKIINGRTYSLWQQFWDQREQWIGGELVDTELTPLHTTIEDVIFEENGDDSAKFGFKGNKFDCWFDVQIGGIGGECPHPKGISFSAAYGGSFYAVKPERVESGDEVNHG